MTKLRWGLLAGFVIGIPLLYHFGQPALAGVLAIIGFATILRWVVFMP